MKNNIVSGKIVDQKCIVNNRSSTKQKPLNCQRHPDHVAGRPFFQAKLAINKPGDQFEKEADAMANKVIRMEAPAIGAKPMPLKSVQRKCAECEEEMPIQRKESNREEATADRTLEDYLGNLNGSGQSLSSELRNFYEPRFGYDFSNVKVHTDSTAARSAQSVNALAYTSGNHIVFKDGHYDPYSAGGRQLLAHELTHVVQQSQSSMAKSIQRQAEVTCSIDVIKIARLFKEDKSVAAEVLDCCEKGLSPLPEGCTSDVINAAKILLGKGGGGGGAKDECPPGWKTTHEKDLEGRCCREGDIPSAKNCCFPYQIHKRDNRCCKADEFASDNECKKFDIKVMCPDGSLPLLNGQCCPPGKINIGSKCIDPKPTPPPPQPKPVVENMSNIGFNKDAPQK